MRRARLPIVLSAAAPFVAIGVTPASAQGPSAPAAAVPEPPRMHFTFNYTATTQTVCAVGSYDTGPVAAPWWTLQIDGVTTAGTHFDWSGDSPNQTANICHTIDKPTGTNGHSDWVFTVTTTDTDYTSASIAGGASWVPNGDPWFGASL